MFKVNISIEKEIFTNKFTYSQKRPMDPFVKKIIEFMITNKTTHSKAVESFGLMDDLKYIAISKFEDEINNSFWGYDNPTLIKMYETGETIIYVSDKVAYTYYPDIEKYLINNNVFDDPKAELERLIKIKALNNEIISQENQYSSNDEEIISCMVDYNLSENAQFKLGREYFEIPLNNQIQNKIIEKISTDNVIPNITLQAYDVISKGDVSLLTKKVHDSMLRNNINYTKFKLSSNLSLKFTNSHVEVAEAHRTTKDIYLVERYNLSFDDFNQSDDFEIVNRHINENNGDFIKGLSPAYITSLFEYKKELVANLVSSNEKFINQDTFEKIKGAKGIVLSLSIEKIKELKSRISSSDFIELFKMLNDESKSQYDDPKDLKKILEKASEKELTTHQLEIVKKYDKKLTFNYDAYISLIGEITTSGIREEIKKHSPKDLKKKGIDKKFKKWIDKNIGHNTSVNKETIDAQMIEKATEVRDKTVKFMSSIKSK